VQEHVQVIRHLNDLDQIVAVFVQGTEPLIEDLLRDHVDAVVVAEVLVYKVLRLNAVHVPLAVLVVLLPDAADDVHHLAVLRRLRVFSTWGGRLFSCLLDHIRCKVNLVLIPVISRIRLELFEVRADLLMILFQLKRQCRIRMLYLRTHNIKYVAKCVNQFNKSNRVRPININLLEPLLKGIMLHIRINRAHLSGDSLQQVLHFILIKCTISIEIKRLIDLA